MEFGFKKYTSSRDPRVRRSYLLIAGTELEMEKKRLKLKLQEFEAEHNKILERIKRGQSSHQEKHKSTVNRAKLRSVQNTQQELYNDLQLCDGLQGKAQPHESQAQVNGTVLENEKHTSLVSNNTHIGCTDNSVNSVTDKDIETSSTQSGETMKTNSASNHSEKEKKTREKEIKSPLRRSKTFSACTSRNAIYEETYRLKLAFHSLAHRESFDRNYPIINPRGYEKLNAGKLQNRTDDNGPNNIVKKRPFLGLISPSFVPLAPFRPVYNKDLKRKQNLRRTFSQPNLRNEESVEHNEPTLAELMKECAKSRYLRTPGNNGE